MADESNEPDGSDAARTGTESPGLWAPLRTVVLVALVGVTGLAVWAVVRWVRDGRAGYGVPAAVLAVACIVWIATFGRPRPVVPSTVDAASTVLRPGPRHRARVAVLAGLAPVVFGLGAFDRSRPDPTPGGAAFTTAFMVVVVLGILAAHGFLGTELRITSDEVVLEIPRRPFRGTMRRARPRDLVDGYRRRLGSVELLPWPLPGGARGAEARSRRVVIPWTVLPTAEVVAALQRAGIRPA